MEIDKDNRVGMRLGLEGKKALIIGEHDLELRDPTAKKSDRSSCGLLRGSSSAKQSVPLYNVLWAEVTNNRITINIAQQSKTKIEAKEWSFSLSTPESSEDDTSAESFVSVLLARAYGQAKPQKRVYVLVNPNSGPGGAIKQWKNEVKPLMDAARMELDVVILKEGGEAVELSKNVDLDKYDTIMACSGDGTPHEIFNGLGQRPDAKKALSRMAVSHIPCGSGNAFSCNLYGSHRPSFAALAIIKGVVTAIDLVSVTQGKTRLLSFLSQTLGLIAESDLGTEHLRWMGAARFEVGVATRLFKRKCYPCDLALKVEVEEKGEIKAHYKRHASEVGSRLPTPTKADEAENDEGLPPLKYGTVEDDLPEGWELVPRDKIGVFYAGNMAYMAPNTNFFSASLISDGCMDLVTLDGNLSPIKALSAMDVESPKFFDNPHVSYKKITAYRIIPRNQKDGYISIDGEQIPFGPLQAEIHQGLGRVISKAGKYEAEGPANWDKVKLSDRLHA